MDGTRFDDLIKRLTQARLTRIDALRGLAASTAVGLAGVTLATDVTDAKKKGKKGNNGKKGKNRKKGKKGGKTKGNGNNGNGNGNENGNEGKFLICHCPPGNPNNCHTISVGSQGAVNAHLSNHPDYEGECTTTTPQQTTTTTLPACVAPPAGFNCTVVGPVAGGTQYSCTSGATLNFGPNGWGGWSCPIGMTAISGTEDLEDQTQAFVAEPGASMYPTYPHYTFNAAAGEEGFVVQNDNDSESGRTITVQCLAPCAVSA